jgi:hypothetical protein
VPPPAARCPGPKLSDQPAHLADVNVVWRQPDPVAACLPQHLVRAEHPPQLGQVALQVSGRVCRRCVSGQSTSKSCAVGTTRPGESARRARSARRVAPGTVTGSFVDPDLEWPEQGDLEAIGPVLPCRPPPSIDSRRSGATSTHVRAGTPPSGAGEPYDVAPVSTRRRTIRAARTGRIERPG